MKRVLLVISVAGCAQGGRATSDAPWGSDAEGVDSPLPIDALSIDAPPSDAPVLVDAPPVLVDAPIDAPPIDAPCTPVSTQLLVNPTFDATPIGTGWVQVPFLANSPLITAPVTGAPPAQTILYYAWLGGYTGFGDDATDWLYQDVTVPPNTTALTLTGYYYVVTNESSSSTVYDFALLELLATDNTLIQTVGGLSNLTPTTAWMPFQLTFTPDLSGQTVRLSMASLNDDSFGTHFWFDSFALTATHCP